MKYLLSIVILFGLSFLHLSFGQTVEPKSVGSAVQKKYFKINAYDYYRYKDGLLMGEVLDSFFIHDKRLFKMDAVLSEYTPRQRELYFWTQVADSFYGFNFYFLFRFHYQFKEEIIRAFAELGYDEETVNCIRKAFAVYEEMRNKFPDKYELDEYPCEIENGLLYDNPKIDKFIRENVDELFRARDGGRLLSDFSGELYDTTENPAYWLKKLVVQNGSPVVEMVFDTAGEVVEQTIFNAMREDSIVGNYYNYSKIAKVRYFMDGNDYETKIVEYFANGNVFRIENNSNNKYDQHIVTYHENGRIASEVKVKHGISYDIIGVWDSLGNDIYQNGNGRIEYYTLREGRAVLHRLLEYEDGLLEGKTVDYYLNGELKRMAYYEKGYLHGVSRSYYDNGSLRSESIYERGSKKNEVFFPKWDSFNLDCKIIFPVEHGLIVVKDMDFDSAMPAHGVSCSNCDAISNNLFSKQFFLMCMPQSFDHGLSFNFDAEILQDGTISGIRFYNDHFSEKLNIEEIKGRLAALKFENIPSLSVGQSLHVRYGIVNAIAVK